MEVLVGKHFGGHSYGPTFNQHKKKFRFDIEIFRKDTREIVHTMLVDKRTKHMTPDELKEIIKDEIQDLNLEKMYFRRITGKKR